ncbi:MAG TPA: NADH-quinone oxidoreductase subunit L [Geobacterales bacterium]|nr:NADH-quinone oxidoreductase subunit L [Geobacterales bacterium]
MIEELAWLIVLVPIVLSFFILAFGKKLPAGGGYIAIAGIIVSLIASIIVTYSIVSSGQSKVLEGFQVIPNFYTNTGNIAGFTWSLYLDNLSVITALVVSVVSLLIFIFSLEYMHGDPGLARYFAEMSFFVGSMQGLVLSNNLIMLYLFWEFVGLASYLLIGFWHDREEVAAAARKAFIVTRIGDVFFLAGITLLWMKLGYLPTVQQIENGVINQLLVALGLSTLIPLLFFGGSIGKSAQFPLHVWLPDAMEGPTTVSALIHSATMVAAGVYLVARLYTMFSIDPIPLAVVGIIGAVTSLYAGILGIAANDIKKVLAYSTISQLGLMMLALGLGLPSTAMMYLYGHAFSKALMFLSAGAVIHELGTRDMLLMGGLAKRMRVAYISMMIGGLSLMGIPPLSLFFIKEPMLEEAFFSNTLLFVLGVLSSFFTAMYWMRMLELTFMGKPRSKEAEHAEPENMIMKVPMYGFMILTLIFGIFAIVTNMPSLFGEGFAYLRFEVDAIALDLLILAITLAGAFLYYRYYTSNFLKGFVNSNLGIGIQKILVNGYYFDFLYERIAKYVGWSFGIVAKIFDEKVIDGFINGLGYAARILGRSMKNIQTGNLEQYLFYIFAVASFLLIIVLAMVV